MNGWLIFLGLLVAYLGLVQVLKRRPQPMPGGFEVSGPFIFWRTQLGKRAIERVARPKKFWNIVADAGIVATWITGIAIFALLLYQVTLYFTATEQVAQNAPAPEFLIGIPGVNPLIPLWYGIIALLVALVVHEGSHGVMAYVARMRVKSLGLLFFIIPVGAFVEPDEEDIERSTTRAKNRVFAAGPASNLVVATFAGILLTGLFLGHVGLVDDGRFTYVSNVVEGEAAEEAGIQEGDFLLAIGGERIESGVHFQRLMNDTRAGETMLVEYRRDGQTAETVVRLGDRGAYERERGAITDEEILSELDGKGFLGVGGLPLDMVAAYQDILAHPFRDGFPGSFSMGSAATGTAPGSFIIYISYPFVVFITGIDVLGPAFHEFLVVEGPMAWMPMTAFFVTANLLFWIVWINIMLASFNALPMGPLDGGQMFKATLRERLMRRYNVDRSLIEVERADVGGLIVRGKDAETEQKLERIRGITSRATWTLGLFILSLVLLPLIGPRLLSLFL